MCALSISGISKSFGEKLALDRVSFDLPDASTLAVLGPSGCGKSTLLSIIAGLEQPDSGDITWDGVSLMGIPPHRRNFGLMFQDFALFPHRDVYANVAFGLQMLGWETGDVRRRVSQVLELVGLPDYEKRDVNTLSGGESQRVALARSLAPQPRLLMLDEPLGSLDRNLRERLVVDLRGILLESRQTAIYVTHDQEEAFNIASRILVMNAGRVEQIGTPQEIYAAPVSVFVARFLGFSNLFPGRVVQESDDPMLETPFGQFPAPGQQPGAVTVLLRPDALSLGGAGHQKIVGELQQVNFRGQTRQAHICSGNVMLEIDLLSRTHLPHIGDKIEISFDPETALLIFPETAKQGEYPGCR